MDFGAVGDGRADDTAAIQRALDSGRKSIYVPAGRYLTGLLTIPDRTCLHGDGPGSVLRLNTTDRKRYLLRTGSDCLIENLSLTSGNKEIESTTNEEPSLIYIFQKSRVTVRNVHLYDFPFTGIHARGSTDLVFSYNRLWNMNEGVRLRRCSRANVSNNSLIDMKLHGMEFWGHETRWPGTWTKDYKMESTDLLFANNYIYNEGGHSGIWGTAAKRVVMANNIVDGATDIGLDLEWCVDSVIIGNTVRNAQEAAIALFYSCQRVSITGNTVINDNEITEEEAKKTWWVRTGIYLTYTNRNTFKDDYGHRDISITGNTIFCAEGERRSIWIGSESDNVVIANNALGDGGVWYGGAHLVYPMILTRLKDDSRIRDGKVVEKK